MTETETRKLAAILAADVVGFSRLTGADEDRTLARLRALRSDLIDPTIAVHHGRVVKRTGDGALVEFRSVVDAVRCAIEMQNAMVERRSRGDSLGSAIRPIEASKAAFGNGSNTSILLKNSEIDPTRKSRIRARHVVSADSPHGRAYGSVARGKTGRSADPLRNFSSRLPAVF